MRDFSAEWRSMQECREYDYKTNVDGFKGRCDLGMKGGATSAASCCKQCNNTPRCQAFTYLSGACFLKSCKDQRPVTMRDAITAVKTS